MPMQQNTEKIYANALNQCLKLGPVRLLNIKERYGSFENGWKTGIDALKKITGVKELEDFRKNIDPEKEYKILENKKITVLLKEELPTYLKEIPIPPEILYIEGSLPNESQTHLAVVGTRKFSSYGKEACEKIVRELREYNFVIVSGMALGIDSIAHKTALQNNMKTIAVLGCGLNESVVYPPQNKKLKKEIVDSGGCVISEHPYTMRAALHTFPQRNRIVAGLSQGTFVIEAPQKSGALITAFMALEYGREVFSLPGSVFSENSKGTNFLLKLGALPVTETADILQNFGISPDTKLAEKSFTETEKQIISFLFEPLEKDELIRKIDLPTKNIIPVLTEMEIKGIIKEVDGQIFKLT